MQDPNAYLSYSPRSFSLLDQTLADLEHACQGHELQTNAEALQILDKLGFTQFFAHAQAQYAKPANLRKALYDWFDAFRTLRFIHECRRFYPDVPLLESLGELFPNLSGYSTSALARHFLTLDTQTYEVTTAMGSASHKRDIYSQL